MSWLFGRSLSLGEGGGLGLRVCENWGRGENESEELTLWMAVLVMLLYDLDDGVRGGCLLYGDLAFAVSWELMIAKTSWVR